MSGKSALSACLERGREAYAGRADLYRLVVDAADDPSSLPPVDEAAVLVQMGVAAQGGVFWGVVMAGAEKGVGAGVAAG